MLMLHLFYKQQFNVLVNTKLRRKKNKRNVINNTRLCFHLVIYLEIN